MKHTHYYLLLLILLSLSACGNTDQAENENELLVAAASNLTLAFTEIAPLFEEETGATVTFSFGSTGQLADQIENGAPFDVFAAANISFIDNLREKEFIFADSQTTYAFGRIGIATLPTSSHKVETINDLLNQDIKKIAIANPNHAPYGLAAKQALQSAGIWDDVEDKLIFGRNISDTLSYIETGNAEAGIIALSLFQEEDVWLTKIENDLHEPLEQSIAVVSQTNQEELSREFITFLTGPIGKPIMESYGFMVPKEYE